MEESTREILCSPFFAHWKPLRFSGRRAKKLSRSLPHAGSWWPQNLIRFTIITLPQTKRSPPCGASRLSAWKPSTCKMVLRGLIRLLSQPDAHTKNGVRTRVLTECLAHRVRPHSARLGPQVFRLEKAVLLLLEWGLPPLNLRVSLGWRSCDKFFVY